jgi:hypothetical protein
MANIAIGVALRSISTEADSKGAMYFLTSQARLVSVLRMYWSSFKVILNHMTNSFGSYLDVYIKQ